MSIDKELDIVADQATQARRLRCTEAQPRICTNCGCLENQIVAHNTSAMIHGLPLFECHASADAEHDFGAGLDPLATHPAHHVMQ